MTIRKMDKGSQKKLFEEEEEQPKNALSSHIPFDIGKYEKEKEEFYSPQLKVEIVDLSGE